MEGITASKLRRLCCSLEVDAVVGGAEEGVAPDRPELSIFQVE